MILICYDGSADAQAATDRAGELFGAQPATVLTVWERFLDVFTGMSRGRPVRLTVAAPPGEGEPLLADREPLLGVSFIGKGSAAPAIEPPRL